MDPVPAALLFGRFPCQCVSAWPVESSGWIHRLLAVFGPLFVTNEDPFRVPFQGNHRGVKSVLRRTRAMFFPCERNSSWCIVLILRVLNLGVAVFWILDLAGILVCRAVWISIWLCCGAISSVPVVDIRLLLLLLYFPAFVNLDVP